jgi:hypothetical protein
MTFLGNILSTGRFGVVRGVGYYRSYLPLMIINNSTYGK